MGVDLSFKMTKCPMYIFLKPSFSQCGSTPSWNTKYAGCAICISQLITPYHIYGWVDTNLLSQPTLIFLWVTLQRCFFAATTTNPDCLCLLLLALGETELLVASIIQLSLSSAVKCSIQGVIQSFLHLTGSGEVTSNTSLKYISWSTKFN